MKNLNWQRRSLSALLAALLIILSAWVPGAAAKTEAELQADLKKLEERIKAQESQISQLKTQQKDQEKLLPALEEQISTVEAKEALINEEIKRLNDSVNELRGRINVLNGDIADCERQIDEIEAQTEEKNAEIKAMQDQLMDRLRQQYMSGPVSNLQLLLSSPDLSSLLTISEYINRQGQRDAQLRIDLEEEMARLKALQDELRVQQTRLEEKKAELQAQSAALAAEIVKQNEERKKLDTEHDRISKAQNELFGIIDGLKTKTKEAQRILQKAMQEQDRAEAALDALLGKKLLSGEIHDVQNNGKMIWPFPYRGCYITSGFGVNESIRDHPHRGIDISIADKSKQYAVTAALDGTIADHGFNKSMGNYVVIHHGYYAPTGKRIKTTYMHLASFSQHVSDGSFIKAGTPIGIMGSTGHSTGPHLHFQINEYTSDTASVAVNPLKYVSNPYK